MAIITALAALGKAGYQAYQADQQKKEAKKLKPSNYVPPGVQEAESNARLKANSSVAPGYGRTVDKLRTSTANTVARLQKASTNSNVIQQGVMDADSKEKEILKDLEVKNEAFKADNMGKLNQVLGLKGVYQEKSRDDYNAAKSALLGASKKNNYNAVSGLAETGIWLSMMNSGGGAMGGASKGIVPAGTGASLKSTFPGGFPSLGSDQQTAAQLRTAMSKMSPYDRLKMSFPGGFSPTSEYGSAFENYKGGGF